MTPATSQPTGRARWAPAGVLLALAVAALLAYRTKREMSILGNADRLLLEILGFWAAWAVALVFLRRTPARLVLPLLVLGAVALRLASVTIVVPLSDDLYRYAWDGAVQASGTDPYRYPPVADELRPLREDWLWPPPAECAERGRDPGCTLVNRETVRTIYPPVAQLWFLAGHLAGASQLRDLGWALVGLVADVATAVLLWRLLRARGRPLWWLAVYAWSPMAVLEAVQNGHVDGLAAFFAVGAVALAGRRPALAGAALGAATMVKLYPALLLPVLLGRGPGRRRLSGPLGAAAAFLAVVLASYLPHVLALGRDVLGYLPGYLAEEDYGGRDAAGEGGSRFLLLDLVGLSGPLATASAVLLGLAVAAHVARRARRSPPGTDLAPLACLLLGAALLVATPVQPWYGVPLAALAALAGRPAWLAVPAAAYPLLFAVVPDGPSPAASHLGGLCYALALAVVVTDEVRRRRKGRAVALPGPS